VTVLDLVQYRSSNPPTRFLWRRSIERAGDVIGISHHGCGEVHREFGRSAHLVEPIAAMEFFETERQPPPRGKTVRIAYWGGWHERKGIAWAIEELGRGPLPGPIELTAIGPQPTKETHGRLRLRVVPATTVSELIDIIDASDVVIYPSSEEGYGLPVVEGLLRDRPVVARALPSYQTFLAHDTPGLLTFDRSQPGSLISAIDRARNVGEGTALSSLAQTDLSAARHRLREQVLAIPSVRRWIELP
jgi:glycosyltransferase involved in cell wall biosynthesis